jgi:hypothetical protein
VPGFGRGLGLRRVALRQGDHGGGNRRRFQPPAVVEQPPRQPRSPELNNDDFPHGRTMRRRLAARLFDMFRICGILCRICADGERERQGGGISGLAPIALLDGDAKNPPRCRHQKQDPGKQTHELVRHHPRLCHRRQERTRDLYDPRDLVAPHSISGAGVFLFLSRPRQSRLRRADHERRTEILADRFLATHLPAK